MQLVQAARDADTDCSQASCSAANSLIGTASAASASVTKTHLTRAQAAPRQFAVARSDFALGDGTRACRARPCHATTLRGAHVATPASAALSGPMTANRSCCCAALRCAKPYGGGSILHGGAACCSTIPTLVARLHFAALHCAALRRAPETPKIPKAPPRLAPPPTKVRMPDAAGSDRQGAARPCPPVSPRVRNRTPVRLCACPTASGQRKKSPGALQRRQWHVGALLHMVSSASSPPPDGPRKQSPRA